jgi:serine/threonine-protein kinase RsbW
MMKQLFPRRIESLDQIFIVLNEFINTLKVDQKAAYGLQLAVEEVFTNLVKYNPASTADIEIQLLKQDQEVIIKLLDFDAEEFDVSKPPAVDPAAPLEKRRAGGLGLYLLHQIMDRVEYHYENRTSTITLVKRLKEGLC